MITGRPKRLDGFSYRGQYLYFVTFCCAFRHESFVTSRVVDAVREQILNAAARHAFAVIAYCFMPDHVHLLVRGQSKTADFRAFASQAKQCSGYWYSQNRQAALWQEGYYERVLRQEETAISVAACIVMNPVKEGIVSSPEQYPFTGSGTYDLREILEWVQAGNRCWQP